MSGSPVDDGPLSGHGTRDREDHPSNRVGSEGAMRKLPVKAHPDRCGRDSIHADEKPHINSAKAVSPKERHRRDEP
jgi:hypothetical protein